MTKNYLNLSWPAVSHNCNLILVPSLTSISLAKKSTPTVGSDSFKKDIHFTHHKEKNLKVFIISSFGKKTNKSLNHFLIIRNSRTQQLLFLIVYLKWYNIYYSVLPNKSFATLKRNDTSCRFTTEKLHL